MKIYIAILLHIEEVEEKIGIAFMSRFSYM